MNKEKEVEAYLQNELPEEEKMKLKTGQISVKKRLKDLLSQMMEITNGIDMDLISIW